MLVRRKVFVLMLAIVKAGIKRQWIRLEFSSAAFINIPFFRDGAASPLSANLFLQINAMKQLLWLLFLLAGFFYAAAQNVGIGTNTPGFPLNFSNALGDKISLYGNSGAHYGLGIQSGLMQVHSDAAFANIAFGYGSSSNFTERMRIINTGENGLQLNGRMTLRNGTSPVNADYSPGIWLYKADNSGLLGFIGTQNNQSIGFFGGPAGWGFTYDAVNSRVGIGNTNPNAPLSFPALLGRKITLYPGSGGNVGMGVYANELRIHTDYEPADVTMGYENLQGNFTERFRFKGNGALAVNGNTGNTGEVLTSNGPLNAPVWSAGTSFIYNNSYKKSSLTFSSVGGAGNPSSIVVPDLAQTIAVSRKVMAMVSWNYTAYSNPCAFCGNISLFTAISFNGNVVHQLDEDVANGNRNTQSGNIIVFLDPGTYNVEVIARNFSSGISVSVGGNNAGVTSSLNIVLYPL